MVITVLEYLQLLYVVCITYLMPVLIHQRYVRINGVCLACMQMGLIWAMVTLARLFKVPMLFTAVMLAVVLETLFLRLFGGLNAPSLQGFFEIRVFILGTFGMMFFNYVEVVKTREPHRNSTTFSGKSYVAYLERT